MCASYGLGGGPHDLEVTFDLPPMHEPEHRETIARWAREQRHTARITGRTSRNLNPLIHAGYGRRTVELAWWWLHINNQPARFNAFNARDDALARKWRAPFGRRAILPAHWYVEKGHTFALPDDELFGIAAIVTPTERDGDTVLSYAMVTREAAGVAAAIHPRMPLVLPRDFHDTWLDPTDPGSGELVTRAVDASNALATEATVVAAPSASD